ncbi:hypothetical protein GCM10023083_44100 [Streptomyces phyllanthi]
MMAGTTMKAARIQWQELPEVPVHEDVPVPSAGAEPETDREAPRSPVLNNKPIDKTRKQGRCRARPDRGLRLRAGLAGPDVRSSLYRPGGEEDGERLADLSREACPADGACGVPATGRAADGADRGRCP